MGYAFNEFPTVEVLVRELDGTMTLVGECQGLSAVFAVEPSSAMLGFMVVETEHGFLYLDPEDTVKVYDDPLDFLNDQGGLL